MVEASFGIGSKNLSQNLSGRVPRPRNSVVEADFGIGSNSLGRAFRGAAATSARSGNLAIHLARFGTVKTISPWLLPLTVACLIAVEVRGQTRVGDDGEVSYESIQMEVFVRSDSERSQQAADFARQLGEATKGLNVSVHDVLEDRQQLSRLWQLARSSGRDKPVVPAFFCCNRLFYGFASGAETGSSIRDLFTMDVYTRSTCPRCAAAKAFLNTIRPRWPALQIRIYEITQDVAARRRWEEICRSHGYVPGLPTFDFAGKAIVGYQGDEITGRQVVDLIQEVVGEAPTRESAESSGQDPTSRLFPTGSLLPAQLFGFLSPPSKTDSVPEPGADFDDVPLPDDLSLPEEALAESQGQLDTLPGNESTAAVSDELAVPWLGTIRVSELGLPLFTFLVGLIDGFNPCAMWILVFLLSVLVNVKDRRRILLIAGTFVFVSGLAYFAFMAAWLNLFMLIGIARPIQIALGVLAVLIGSINVKDFFAFKQGVSLSIPESSKPGLYRRVREIVATKYLSVAIGGAITLAVVVNLVELLCTAGLPALYTQILSMQELPAWQNYVYLGLYIAAYMFDDTMLLGIVVATLSHRKLQEREGRWLKLISGVVILALGVVMILRPEWLQLGSLEPEWHPLAHPRRLSTTIGQDVRGAIARVKSPNNFSRRPIRWTPRISKSA